MVLHKKIRRKLKKKQRSSEASQDENPSNVVNPKAPCVQEIKKTMLSFALSKHKKIKKSKSKAKIIPVAKDRSNSVRIQPQRNLPEPSNALGMIQISATSVKRATRKPKIVAEEKHVTKEEMEEKSNRAREYRLQTRRRVAARREQLKAMAELEVQNQEKAKNGAGMERRNRVAQKQRLRAEIYAVNELNVVDNPGNYLASFNFLLYFLFWGFDRFFFIINLRCGWLSWSSGGKLLL